MARKLHSLLPSPGTVLGGVALIVALSGVAVAAIPGSDGTVTACISKGGQVKVIDAERGKTCTGRHTTVKLAATDASGKAANADLLDGKDSTEFLEATAKASDSHLLDGIDSTELGGFLTGRINNLFQAFRALGRRAALHLPSAGSKRPPTSPNIDLQARDLTVRLIGPGPEFATFRLWVEKVPTSLSCVIAGDDQECSATGPVPVAAGSLLSVGVDTSDDEGVADALFSLRLTP